MRFSDNGYYIEKYIKCSNCGVLIYDKGQPVQRGGKELIFCSNWCDKWAEMREAGVKDRRLALPRSSA